jgi:hypothetical protein
MIDRNPRDTQGRIREKHIPVCKAIGWMLRDRHTCLRTLLAPSKSRDTSLPSGDVCWPRHFFRTARTHLHFARLFTRSTQTAHDHNIGTVAAESDGEEDEDCDEHYQLNQQSHVPVDHAPVRTACANTA